LPTQQAPDNIYNTFNGFEAENTKLMKTDIENSLIIKHIKNICNNDDKCFDYMIKFMANMIQSPHKIPGVALLIKSVQGVGKDTLFDWFGNNILNSEYYINTEKLELLTGKFSSCLENKILIVMNETSGRDTFEKNENIKNSITAKVNMIEHKGHDAYKNTNNISYIFLTNNDNPMKITFDDRRFCGIECNNNIANDFEYFKNLYTELESKVYDRAFYEYLLNVDLNNYNFLKNRPQTSFYNNMKEMNIPILAKFFETIVDANIDSDQVEIMANTLYEKFIIYIKDNNFKIECSSTKFGIDIKGYTGIEKKRVKLGNCILININQLREHLQTKYKIEFVKDDAIDNFIDEVDNNEDMI